MKQETELQVLAVWVAQDEHVKRTIGKGNAALEAFIAYHSLHMEAVHLCGRRALTPSTMYGAQALGNELTPKQSSHPKAIQSKPPTI